MQLFAQAREISRTLRAQGVQLPFDGQLLDILPDPASLPTPELRELAQRAWLLLETARAEADSLATLGAVVHDLERGLVDLRSVLDGEREVWLCWRLGDREILHFHEMDSGYLGREPIRFHRFFRTRQLVPPRSSE